MQVRVDILNLLAIGNYTAKQISSELGIDPVTVRRNIVKIDYIYFLKLIKRMDKGTNAYVYHINDLKKSNYQEIIDHKTKLIKKELTKIINNIK